ncbi:hypothetical protein EYC98_02600 [Halieaceae bacterium IMCC14734]|uniref:DUF3991 domain-containing protein n=1 Tax=Candidatus Litorirhabdus singularis TaxID=2518993 RepID=A0ABT3TBU1_9GAMM|nr:hypothetical protein [Candidatus Litorirhabdus singularis]MCX2979749.1 hypothetical protein [Candidatus Litorirhabdus singularis]
MPMDISIEAIAQALLGEPNAKLSSKSELRFGNRGSLSVNLDDACWFDHEQSMGGGPADLVMFAKGGTLAEAMRYLYGDNRAPVTRQKPKPKPKAESSTFRYACELWKGADRADSTVAAHDYAKRKQITWAAGAGRTRASGRVIGKGSDCIVLPLRTWSDELTGVEVINVEGAKQTFGRKGVLQLGNTRNTAIPIYITEGWADAVATWKYFGDVVVVAVFGIAKLDSTALELDKIYPERELIIVRDEVRKCP